MKISESLFGIARKDLKAAKCLFESGYYPQAVFYLQQSVEKANKSWAVVCNLITSIVSIPKNPDKIHFRF
jgi:3-methyladenine DNA glycosylase AlkD